MVVIEVVGVLALSLVLMELVCGKILEEGGPLYLGFVCMKLEMDQILCKGDHRDDHLSCFSIIYLFPLGSVPDAHS